MTIHKENSEILDQKFQKVLKDIQEKEPIQPTEIQIQICNYVVDFFMKKDYCDIINVGYSQVKLGKLYIDFYWIIPNKEIYISITGVGAIIFHYSDLQSYKNESICFDQDEIDDLGKLINTYFSTHAQLF